MEQVTACPNCKAAIKFGVFDSNLIIPKEKTEAINFVLKTKASAHCDVCGDKAMAEARSQFLSLFNDFKNYVSENSGIVPITTIPMPFGWSTPFWEWSHPRQLPRTARWKILQHRGMI